MKIFNEINFNKNLSLVFGFFDGVHIGHQAVIKSAVDFAKKNNTKSAIITFQDHPCCFFYNVPPKYIIKRHDKIKFFEDLGVDFLYSIKFDEYLSMMSASEYLQNVIVKNFTPLAISTGFNHYFGAKKSGDVNFLSIMQSKFGYQYFEIPPVLFNSEIVSSTRIREDIGLGNIELVNSMLGYNYFLEETVIEGQHLGRTIGFKTANLIYPDNLVEIGHGVYKVIVEHNGKIYNGIANYGLRPTVAHNDTELQSTHDPNVMLNSFQHRMNEQPCDPEINLWRRDSHRLIKIQYEKSVLEVHILNFDKEIYKEKIKVIFLKKIREEKKFNSLDELKLQILEDIKNL